MTLFWLHSLLQNHNNILQNFPWQQSTATCTAVFATPNAQVPRKYIRKWQYCTFLNGVVLIRSTYLWPAILLLRVVLTTLGLTKLFCLKFGKFYASFSKLMYKLFNVFTYLKIYSCRFENLSTTSSSHEKTCQRFHIILPSTFWDMHTWDKCNV